MSRIAVRAPLHGSYLNIVLADQELVGGFEPRIGSRHVRVVAVHGYPQASHAGALDVLNTLALRLSMEQPRATARTADRGRV